MQEGVTVRRSSSVQLGIPDNSPVWKYTVEDDATFYLTATSGFFKGEFPGAVEDLQSDNWIGARSSATEPW